MHLFRRFITFSGLGVLAFVVDIALLALLTELFDVFYMLSATLAFICATSGHYIAARHYAFPETKRPFRQGYAFFIAIASINLIVTLVLLNLLVEKLGFYYLLARVLVSAAVGIFNFATNSVLNFNIPLTHG